jgi:Raf kinase inhibitor-like YbhB/YbcL family protein
MVTAGPRHHSSTTVTAVLVATLLLAVVACSSSSGGDAVSTTTTDRATTSTTPGSGPDEFMLTSTAFKDGTSIPATYACQPAGGDGQSPPLMWSGVPEGTATLVLVVHDPDAPIKGGFTHLVTTIDPSTDRVAANAGAKGGPMADWRPPCPPSGTHHYVFTLYAMPDTVTIPDAPDKAFVDAHATDALATTTLTGLFTKP